MELLLLSDWSVFRDLASIACVLDLRLDILDSPSLYSRVRCSYRTMMHNCHLGMRVSWANLDAASNFSTELLIDVDRFFGSMEDFDLNIRPSLL